MDVELTTSSPVVAIIVGLFSGASVIASTLVSVLVKKWLKSAEETAKLKEEVILKQIESSASQIRSEMILKAEKLSGEFRLLEAKVLSGVKDAEKCSLEQANRLASAMQALANWTKESKRQFEVFQNKLEQTHIWVERIKKTRGE